ncbi:MAG TPA: glycosyltransferase [Candidatus Acidoferrum sp.]
MNRISACIITLNEERNLPRALASIANIADEIIIVDSGSTDRTEQVARAHNASFFARPWTNYADQKNFAAAQASSDWILSLDADEELSTTLQSSLLAWKKLPPAHNVYEIPRKTWYLGAWIHHSGWYPDFQRRLYLRTAAQFHGIIHESLRFQGYTGRLSGDLLHYTVDSFAGHEAKVERYTSLAAQQMFDAGKRNWRAAVYFATPWSFFQNFILRGGFLDGHRGALISKMAARSVRLKYSKLGKLIAAPLHPSSQLVRPAPHLMKPLLVDLETAWRGGQNQAFLLLKGLQSRGHSPELVAAENSALAERTARIGIPVHTVSRGLFRFPASRKIRQLLATNSFDLVHANEAHAVSAAWLAQAHRRVPFLISRRVGYPLGQSRIARARYQAATNIIANSQWVADQARASGAPPEKLCVIFEGVEIPAPFTADQKRQARQRFSIPADTPLLGCVGVLLPDKGQEWLIRALPQVHQDFPAAKLLLAGDGPTRPHLESLARQLHLSDSVIFAGFVSDVETVYAALDIFLLPSFFEALNNSLLAAKAYEIPSIAFRRGALPEIIDHEKSGLLVSGPDASEIAAAVTQLLRDPTAARALAHAGRLRVQQNFSADHMVDQTLLLYQKILAQKG